MHDDNHDAENLAARAFLYAGGELPEPEVAEFERQLGEDQAARDALCQAVQMISELDGFAAPAPAPSYREGVRSRLAPQRAAGFIPAGTSSTARQPIWSRLASRRMYRGH